MQTQKLRLIVLGVSIWTLLCGCNGASSGGGGAGGTGGGTIGSNTTTRSSIPTSADLSGASNLMLGASETTFSAGKKKGLFLHSLFNPEVANAGLAKKILLALKNRRIEKVQFHDGDSGVQVSSIRSLGPSFLLVGFSSNGTGVMRKSDGRIFDISSYIESDKLYAVEYGGLVYVGNARKKQIYEINPTSSHVRKVNNANLNPVRLEGPNGDFWVAKDVNDASAIVGGYVENGTCVNQNFCLFFSDGSANALGNIGTYSWPGRSIIYADNGKIYGWTAGFSLTGGSWSEYGKILLFEFSKTPFGNGTLGQVTETTVHNSSGSGEPYPGQIPTQNDNWFDNGDKYYFTAYGYYKMEKVPGAGASFTYTSLDLSPLYGQGGAIPSLTWIDPITGLSRESRAIAKMGDYLYFKKGNSISRIGLLNGGVVEVIYTNSSVYNFTVGDNAVIAMAPGVTYRIDLTDNSIEQISEDLGIETSISL